MVFLVHIMGTRALGNIETTGKVTGRKGSGRTKKIWADGLKRCGGGIPPVALTKNTKDREFCARWSKPISLRNCINRIDQGHQRLRKF